MSTRCLFAVFALAAAFVLPEPAHAQITAISDWADAVASVANPRWVGQRVPYLVVAQRPVAAIAAESFTSPVAIHSGRAIAEKRLNLALKSLEKAHELFYATGFGEPIRDGGRGGSSSFDLYFAHVPDGTYDTVFEARAYASPVDAGLSFALIDDQIADEDLEACLTSAYAESLLLAKDPAESFAWRRAYGTYLTFLATGKWGCTDEATRASFAHSDQSPIADPERIEEGRRAEPGALFLALLDAHRDFGNGIFVRDLYDFSRQLTWDGVNLRGAPDVWMALYRVIKSENRSIENWMETLATDRYLASFREPDSLGLRPLAPLPKPQMNRPVAWKDLPKYRYFDGEFVESMGSSYTIVDTRDAPQNALLRVWLSGEYGVQWQLVAVRLDEHEHEISRLSAPARNIPRSYLPVELLDHTDHVLVIVTNLDTRVPDADIANPNERAFKLAFDQNREGAN